MAWMPPASAKKERGGKPRVPLSRGPTLDWHTDFLSTGICDAGPSPRSARGPCGTIVTLRDALNQMQICWLLVLINRVDSCVHLLQS